MAQADEIPGVWGQRIPSEQWEGAGAAPSGSPQLSGSAPPRVQWSFCSTELGTPIPVLSLQFKVKIPPRGGESGANCPRLLSLGVVLVLVSA